MKCTIAQFRKNFTAMMSQLKNSTMKELILTDRYGNELVKLKPLAKKERRLMACQES